MCHAYPHPSNIACTGIDSEVPCIQVSEDGLAIGRTADVDCLITDLALPAGGHVLFAGTERGCLRAYKLPLGTEFQVRPIHLPGSHKTLYRQNL